MQKYIDLKLVTVFNNLVSKKIGKSKLPEAISYVLQGSATLIREKIWNFRPTHILYGF